MDRKMDRKTRPALLYLLTLALASLGLLNAAQASPPKTPAEMRADAELHDVHFIDVRRGFAVGDRGVILSTTDGGRNWGEQIAHEHVALRSISFSDPQHGWIVGGYVEPYRHTSRAVILKTEDGGKRWTPIQAGTMPSLKRICMLDAKNGWAVGDSSSLFPSGVFRTSDGGQSWTTAPVGRAQGLLTGDFVSERRGVIAGADGQLQIVLGDEVVPTRTPDLGQRPLRCLRMLDISRGWLVGADGLVLQTTDGGVSWRRSARRIPATGFDFTACAVVGSSIWVAGEPGTFIYHSSDDGRTWSAARTGVQTPIRALHFVTPQVGWAVGSLGVVLTTIDGGQSWKVQRQGGERLALWMVAPQQSAPLEALANVSGGDGYLSRLTVLFSQSPRDAFVASAQDRTHEAATSVGASGGTAAWQFRLDDLPLFIDKRAAAARVDSLADGDGRRELQRFLVQQIRQWRPSVVVAASSESPFSQATFEQLQIAVNDAADPTKHSDQITVQGLSAHRVARMFVTAPHGPVELSSSRLLANVGVSAGGFADYGRSLLNSRFTVFPETVSLISVQGGRELRGLFDNLTGLAHGRGARRLPGPPLVANLAQLRRMIQQNQNVRTLLANRESQPETLSNQAALVGQLDDLTAGVDQNSAAQINFQLGDSLRKAGNLEAAANALARLVQRHPESPHTSAAAMWLIQYYASKEIRRRENENSGMVAGQGRLRMKGRAQAVDASPFSAREPEVKQAGFSSGVEIRPATLRAATSDLDRRRATVAMDYARLVQQTRPALYEDPRVRFSVAAAQRSLGQLRAADGFYRRISGTDSPPGWRESAAAELWLAHKQGRPPKTLQPCFLTSEKPRLDGRLNERFWRAAQPIDLTSNEGASPEQLGTRIWVSYDLEYLYLAGVCQTRETPQVGDGPRERDSDQSRFDRIQFFVDVNRDYSSYYEFEIDERGWGSEACFGDRSWNPNWHIAHATAGRLWMFEAAIPFRELTDSKSIESQVWSFGVQRVTPNTAFQSWTKPAAVERRPEGFGLISFDLEK